MMILDSAYFVIATRKLREAAAFRFKLFPLLTACANPGQHWIILQMDTNLNLFMPHAEPTVARQNWELRELHQATKEDGSETVYVYPLKLAGTPGEPSAKYEGEEIWVEQRAFNQVAMEEAEANPDVFDRINGAEHIEGLEFYRSNGGVSLRLRR